MTWLVVIGKVGHASITFQGESVDGSYAHVRSLVTIGRGREIPIEYRLVESGARWAVYDVVTGGTSVRSKDLEAQR